MTTGEPGFWERVRTLLSPGPGVAGERTSRPAGAPPPSDPQPSADRPETVRDRSGSDDTGFQTLATTITAAVFICREDAIVFANPGATVVTGYTRDELLALRFSDLVHASFRETLQHFGAIGPARGPAPPRYETKLLAKAGEERWVDLTLTPLEFEGRPCTMATAFDITDRKLAENGMREAERRMQDVLENVQMISVQLDTRGEITFCNPYLLELTGYEEEDVLGRDWFDLFLPAEHRESVRRNFLEQMRRSAVAPHDENEILTGQGERRLVAWNHTVLRDLGGALIGMAAMGADVTDRRKAEAQLVHDAFHDGLTGLPNRALFLDRLSGTTARARRRPGALFAVLFVDVDRFKVVNDSLGHAVGDLLLIEIARALSASVRPGDTVARLGGDEFTLLIDDMDEISDATRVAERIQAALAAPFPLQGHDVSVSASIGIALSASGYNDTEDLLRDADTAMYHAKSQGKARHQIFDASMHEQAVLLLRMENSLRRAVEHGEFTLHYQPIVKLVDGHIVGFEALVRWQHPQRGLVSPVEFIHLAEEMGLILAIGAWTLREACRQVRAWAAEGLPPVLLNVNLSGRQFQQPDLLEEIEAIFRETGFPPGQLKLEITESVIMENAESAIAMLDRLRSLGTRVAIDDFGTGYSSLSYLLRLPADTLKIDRSFVAAMGSGLRNVQIVQTIASLAQTLGMDVVAEGVETEEQRRELQGVGVVYGQGFLFSKAVDAKAARELLLADGARTQRGE